MDERGATFSPDGNIVVYSVRIADYRQVLIVAERHGGRWGKPEVAPFSGVAFDGTPSFSPDGRRLFFASDRAPDGGSKDFDIWVVTRTATGWGVPKPVGAPISTSANEIGPILTRSGKLYFVSSRTGGGDIYVADPAGDGFGEPRSVGSGVNSDYPEGGPAINPDETIMVFTSAGRPDQPLAKGHPYTRSDLYLSRRTGDQWGPAKRLGPAINTLAVETGPAFSPDGKWLYFVSEHGFATDQQVVLTPRTLHRGWTTPLNGLGNVYKIGALCAEGGSMSWLALLLTFASAGSASQPAMLEPSVISTPANEFGGSITRDGRELWYSSSVQHFYMETIFFSRKLPNGHWGPPTLAPFSGHGHDFDPGVSPDGKRMLFISDRPTHPGEKKLDYDIWYVDRKQGGGWGKPQRLPEPVNSRPDANGEGGREEFASLAADGTIYFASERSARPGMAIYRSRLVAGKYQAPELLPDIINAGPLSASR